MLHHSNSRHQRNRGSRIKTLLQVTLLVGVVVWLLFQVKHSYDKKNEYFNDTEDHLAHYDRSMFRGRKERVGSYGDSNVEMVFENSDVISKPEEEKSGETVFAKDNTDLHEDDTRNTERSETEEGQASGADGNAEAHTNVEDVISGQSGADKHDSENENVVRATGDDVPQYNHVQGENTGEINEKQHEEVAQSDGSTNADQTNASITGSDGDQAEKMDAVESNPNLESHSGTTGEHYTETLPDETGNIPSVHNENPQHDPSENQVDIANTTSDASDHSTNETVHIETGSEHEGASGDAEKGNSVESNSFVSISVEEKAGASHSDGNVAVTGTADETSGSKEQNSEEGNAASQDITDQAVNVVTENSQAVSAAEIGNVWSEKTNHSDNLLDAAATKMSSNGEHENIKIETNTSAVDEHKEPEGVDDSSGSTGSNGNGPEQIGKAESQ